MKFRNYTKEQIPLQNRYEVFNKRSLKPVKHTSRTQVISSLEIDNLIDYLQFCIIHNIQPNIQPTVSDITDIIHSISENRIIYNS